MKPEFTKFGPKENYKHAHCTLDYRGQTLLGEIRHIWRNEVTGMWLCYVIHMNGEPWPIDQVALSSLTILERD